MVALLKGRGEMRTSVRRRKASRAKETPPMQESGKYCLNLKEIFDQLAGVVVDKVGVLADAWKQR